MKAQCILLAAKPTLTLTPATLRIVDRRLVKLDPPKAQGCAFQLTAAEAKAALDVFASMFLSFALTFMPLLCLFVVPVLGMFLVNSLPVLVLFDSGASRSFVSQAFSREFSAPFGELESPL